MVIIEVLRPAIIILRKLFRIFPLIVQIMAQWLFFYGIRHTGFKTSGCGVLFAGSVVAYVKNRWIVHDSSSTWNDAVYIGLLEIVIL